MRIDTYEINKTEDIDRVLSAVRKRTEVPDDVTRSVEEIVHQVRSRGDEAVLEMTERYDGVSMDAGDIEVPPGARAEAWESLDGEIRAALQKARSRITAFAEKSLVPDWESEVSSGLTVGQVFRPLDRAGIYVPGGRFPYPSTVLMAGIPARVAGVGEVVFCAPPGSDGSVNYATLAATTLVDGCRVFKVGGAQAIAAMAYGTDSIPQCRMLAGPGNIYVTVAKRLVSNTVRVDLEAGPSEIAVYADSTTDLSFAVSDMLAQLEHDPVSLALLVTESKEVLESTTEAFTRLTGGSEEESGEGTASLVRCPSEEISIELLNELAPEHLEIMVDNPREILPAVNSAGCVFLGPYSPVALGDYIAGPSHVLPTGGASKRFSGLSAQEFRKALNLVSYSREGLLRDAGEAKLLANLEHLERHALSIDIRERSPGE